MYSHNLQRNNRFVAAPDPRARSMSPHGRDAAGREIFHHTSPRGFVGQPFYGHQHSQSQPTMTAWQAPSPHPQPQPQPQLRVSHGSPMPSPRSSATSLPAPPPLFLQTHSHMNAPSPMPSPMGGVAQYAPHAAPSPALSPMYIKQGANAFSRMAPSPQIWPQQQQLRHSFGSMPQYQAPTPQVQQNTRHSFSDAPSHDSRGHFPTSQPPPQQVTPFGTTQTHNMDKYHTLGDENPVAPSAVAPASPGLGVYIGTNREGEESFGRNQQDPSTMVAPLPRQMTQGGGVGGSPRFDPAAAPQPQQFPKSPQMYLQGGGVGGSPRFDPAAAPQPHQFPKSPQMYPNAPLTPGPFDGGNYQTIPAAPVQQLIQQHPAAPVRTGSGGGNNNGYASSTRIAPPQQFPPSQTGDRPGYITPRAEGIGEGGGGRQTPAAMAANAIRQGSRQYGSNNGRPVPDARGLQQNGHAMHVAPTFSGLVDDSQLDKYGTPTPTPDKAQHAYQQQRGAASVPSRSILGGAADLQEQGRQHMQPRDRFSGHAHGPPFDGRAAFQRGGGQQQQEIGGVGQQQQQQQQFAPAQPQSYPLPKFAQQQQQGANQQGENSRLIALQTRQQVQQLVLLQQQQQQQQQQHLSESNQPNNQGYGHGGGVDARRSQQFVAQAPQPGNVSEDDFETTTVETEGSDMQSDLDYDDGFGITIVLEESRPMDEIYSWLQTGIMQDIADAIEVPISRLDFVGAELGNDEGTVLVHINFLPPAQGSRDVRSGLELAHQTGAQVERTDSKLRNSQCTRNVLHIGLHPPLRKVNGGRRASYESSITSRTDSTTSRSMDEPSPIKPPRANVPQLPVSIAQRLVEEEGEEEEKSNFESGLMQLVNHAKMIAQAREQGIDQGYTPLSLGRSGSLADSGFSDDPFDLRSSSSRHFKSGDEFLRELSNRHTGEILSIDTSRSREQKLAELEARRISLENQALKEAASSTPRGTDVMRRVRNSGLEEMGLPLMEPPATAPGSSDLGPLNANSAGRLSKDEADSVRAMTEERIRTLAEHAKTYPGGVEAAAPAAPKFEEFGGGRAGGGLTPRFEEFRPRDEGGVHAVSTGQAMSTHPPFAVFMNSPSHSDQTENSSSAAAAAAAAATAPPANQQKAQREDPGSSQAGSATDFLKNLDGAVAKAKVGVDDADMSSGRGVDVTEPGANLTLGIVLEPSTERPGMFQIHSIVKGSVADTQTNIRKGDTLIAVDGVTTAGKQLEDIMEEMVRACSFILHRDIKPLASFNYNVSLPSPLIAMQAGARSSPNREGGATTQVL